MPDELVVLINVFDVPPEDGNRFLASARAGSCGSTWAVTRSVGASATPA
jgi:hypothetical protein